MKKSLLALAVLGAFASGAHAQTNVTIGGIIQVLVKNYKVGNLNTALRPVGQTATNELRIDDDYGSRFWFTGSEDLGGGLSAQFYVQSRFNTDVGPTASNGLANGDTWVGLKGDWGRVTFGRQTLMDGQGSAVEFGGNGMPALSNGMIASKTILGYIGSQSISATRINNVILYTSPTYSGFTGSVAVSPGGSATNEGVIGATVNNQYSDGKQVFLLGNYTNGPIYLNAAYWKSDTEGRNVGTAVTAANADQQQWRLSGSYAFTNGLKLGLQYDRATLSSVGRTAGGVGGSDWSRSAWQLPASYTVGPHTVQASYTKANAVSNVANSGAKMWVVGYDYALSKRTNVGVFYSKLDNDAGIDYRPNGGTQNGSALLSGESASIFTLGLLHKF